MSEDAPHPPEPLHALLSGDPKAQAELFAVLERELRLIAREIGRDQVGHTMHPTALFDEAWRRMFGRKSGTTPTWNNRAHFLNAAAQTMRTILVDHCRKKRAQKRGNGAANLPLDELVHSLEARCGTNLEALDEVLNQLAKDDATAAAYVNLRFFGDRTAAETARILGIPERTAARRWKGIRAWMQTRLQP